MTEAANSINGLRYSATSSGLSPKVEMPESGVGAAVSRWGAVEQMAASEPHLVQL